MARLIALSIDVTKLSKDKFVKGKKGTYANLTISVNDEPDNYGNDVSVWEGQSKEEREAKEDRNFLGNGKTVWTSEDSSPSTPAKKSKPAKARFEEEEDDLPF